MAFSREKGLAAGMIAAGLAAVLFLLGAAVFLQQSRMAREREEDRILIRELAARESRLSARIQALEEETRNLRRTAPKVSAKRPTGAERRRNLAEGRARRVAAFHEHMERVVKNAAGDRERAILLAEHVAAEVGNDRPENFQDAGDWLAAWEARRGLCSDRSHILQKALARFGISSRIYNIYDYGFGHTCLSATYDGAEHFFDPTYAGYFAAEDGRVLSFDQVLKDPEKAVSGMRVFLKTRDVNADGGPMDNRGRMESVYDPEKLKTVRAAGVKASRVFPLSATLDLSGLLPGKPLWFGQKNDRSGDMRSPAVQQQTRCYYLDALGDKHDRFSHEFRLAGLSGKTPVLLRFYFTRFSRGAPRLTAKAQKGALVRGRLGPEAGSFRTWEVEVLPDSSGEAVLVVEPERHRRGSYAGLDAIEVVAGGNTGREG